MKEWHQCLIALKEKKGKALALYANILSNNSSVIWLRSLVDDGFFGTNFKKKADDEIVVLEIAS